jgi:hypothetical protein
MSHLREPGHLGRSFGSRSSPPKRAMTFGMRSVCETEHSHVDVVAIKRMTAWTERQALAIKMHPFEEVWTCRRRDEL